MSKELRVAIAKDVLERIVPNPDLGVEPLGYIETGTNNEVCQVCALGAMALSALCNDRLGETLGVDPEIQPEYLENTLAFENFIRKNLMQVFSPEQLGLIEVAFEGQFTGFWGDARLDSGHHPSSVEFAYDPIKLDDASQEQFERLGAALTFSKQEDVPRLRLKMIMENIVKNGEFRPEAGA